MLRWMAMAVLVLAASRAPAQEQAAVRPAFNAFDVATVKPVEADAKAGRVFHMDGTHRWVATNYTLKELIALAYDLNPSEISGGPEWMDSEHFTIEAVTPGDVAPTRMEQMKMLRALLVERFSLTYHSEEKEFDFYLLTVGRSGSKLMPAAKPDEPPEIVGVVYPDRVEVPARNVTMEEFVAMLQRATLDRPVVNRTGLTGRYDFNLKFAQDETVYGGELPRAPDSSDSPHFFTAVQEQLGLKLVPTRGMVSTMAVDGAERPGAD